MNIQVFYNSNLINPTPLVNQEVKFIDYIGYRHGNVIEITLNGSITGINSTGNVSQITSIFANQFKKLEVYQTNPSGLIYSWPNTVVESIDFSQSHYYGGVNLPYSIKLKSYNVPSGITNPVNKWEFQLNEDSTVTVKHDISADGIKNISGAFINAVNFVKNFTGQQPFQQCSTFFIPSGSGILMSISERIDRLNCSYSVNEVWKYNTGINQIYTKLSSLDFSDSLDGEYLTLDYNVKFQGSPIQRNIPLLDSGIKNFNVLNDISNLGIVTTNLVQSSSEITRNSGDSSVTFKISYLSGYNVNDLNGFFDYDISLDRNCLLPKDSWKIEGDFICRGPISYKLQQLNNFKSTYSNNWRNYLVGLISGSPLFTTFHSGGNILSSNPTLNIKENTGLAIFQLSLSIDDGGELAGINNPKYLVNVIPSKWSYELVPASNIEGKYIVQDLQMATQSKIDVSLSAESSESSNVLSILSGQLNELNAIYINTGFIIESKYATGIRDLSCSNNIIGRGSFDQELLDIKCAGSLNGTNFTRVSGFYFGM